MPTQESEIQETPSSLPPQEDSAETTPEAVLIPKEESSENKEASPLAQLSYIGFSVEVPQGTSLRITIETSPVVSKGGEDEQQKIFVSEIRNTKSGPVSVALPLEPTKGVRFPAGSRVIPAIAERRRPIGLSLKRLAERVKAWPYTLEITLFGTALVIYLLTRFIGLTHFPIYFFCDEAVQTLLAADFIRDNFRNAAGEFLPTYFFNVEKYNLSVTVYLQVLPYLLFGMSEFVTRAVSVLLTLLAAFSVGRILRDIFNLSYWWSATLILSITPAWFLHSRTAFETVTMVSFYAGAIYFYLLYRYKSPRNLYVSLILFALAFYSYNPGQVIVVLTGFLLLISDARYHWQNRQVTVRALGLLVLLVLPYIRFRLNHPGVIEDHFIRLGSYWVQPISIQEKFKAFLSEYFYGLSPGYWFIPNERDLPRHLMKGYGHLWRVTLPFAFLGLIVSLKNIRSAAYRTLLITLITAPSGGALAQITITRALVMVIPASIFIAIGVITILTWLEKRGLHKLMLSLGLMGVLSGMNIYILKDALVNGPLWFQDYGLGGMQYGASQLFREVEYYIEENPGVRMIVSPSWANGADVVARFFMTNRYSIQLGSIDEYLYRYIEIDKNTLFVMTAQEFEVTNTCGKFTDIQVEKTLPYPNGKPGFYFVRLRYVDNIGEILAAEKEQRRQLKEAEVLIEGKLTRVKYSLLDMGQIQDVWDGNPHSVTRTFEANPYIIEIEFPEVRLLSGLSLVIGDAEFRVVAQLFSESGVQVREFTADLRGTVPEPQVTFTFPTAEWVKVLRLEVYDLRQSEPGHVHIWEITFH